MRMILIALGALIVLGGAAAGAYFYFLNPAQAAVGEDGQEVAKAEKHSKKKKDGHGEAFEFVELDPLILPIVDNNGVSQVVSMVIAIEVPDAESKARVEMMTPKLKDAFIQDMYGALSRHAALKGGVLQVSYLKERLNKVGVEVLGESMSDVLIQVVQQRPI